VKPFRTPIKCIIQTTESFKVAYDFCLFFYIITDLNQSTLTTNRWIFIQTFLCIWNVPECK